MVSVLRSRVILLAIAMGCYGAHGVCAARGAVDFAPSVSGARSAGASWPGVPRGILASTDRPAAVAMSVRGCQQWKGEPQPLCRRSAMSVVPTKPDRSWPSFRQAASSNWISSYTPSSGIGALLCRFRL